MREVLTFKFKQKKRRAIELYDADTPFRQKIEKDRKRDTKPKHRKAWLEEV